MGSSYTDFRDLVAYKKAFLQGCLIFEMTMDFPKTEQYSLTDQIRRSSRSICANIAEAYRKRDYHKHFLLKLTDCLGENSETLVWLDFALQCKYINTEVYTKNAELNSEVGKLLPHMYNHPEKYGVAPL